MKKNDFDNRLQNDLFPEMPRSFGRKLTQTMEEEGVRIKKRPGATAVFTGVVSVLAVTACLVIVLIGALGGGKSRTDAAASPETAVATEAPMHTPKRNPRWNWDTKVISLSAGFEFENQEKYEALYKGILRFLMIQGQEEPDELWLCAIKPRRVEENALDGYFVLAKHSFGLGDGPELYCLTDEGDVLWATEGSGQGPNQAVHPLEDSYTELIQRHFLYGTEPMIAEPGVPHVKRGAVVGKEKGMDIEFSMAASIIEVQSRLSAAGSAYPGAAREFFLVTIPTGSWDAVMQAHTLRFETEEGPVDIDMETELPEAKVVMGPQPHSDVDLVKEVQQKVLAATETKILDLTGRTCLTGEPDFGTLILRALETSGVYLPGQIWICGIQEVENANAFGQSAYVLAECTRDGDNGPELYFYNNGVIQWMSVRSDPERINVLYHDGNTIVFGKSRAYDNGAIAMKSGTLVFEDGEERAFVPVLPLSKVRQIVTGGHYFDAAREWYLLVEPGEREVKRLSVQGENGRTYILDKVSVLTSQSVPAMAVESDGVVYPGKVTHLAHALGENGLAADGSPLMETLRGTTFEEIKIVRNRDRALPWEIITASDNVTADRVEVYSENLERLYNNAEISVIDSLPAGRYYLCFHTTVLGPYSEKIGKYTYRTDYTIYKVALMGEARLSVTSGDETVEARHLFFVDDPDGDGVTHYLNVDIALEKLPTLLISETHLEMETIPEHDLTVENVIAFNEQMKTVLEGKDPEILHELPKGIYTVCIYARRDRSYELLGKSSMGDVEVFAFGARVE